MSDLSEYVVQLEDRLTVVEATILQSHYLQKNTRDNRSVVVNRALNLMVRSDC